MGEPDGSSRSFVAGGRSGGRWSIQGMKAVVIGGSKGIGKSVVEELAKLGVSVHTCCRKEAELTECLREWKGQGFRVAGYVCDLSVREQREELMRTVSSTFDGKLNILINNVRTNIRKNTVEFSPEDFSFLVSTNLESAYHMCQLCYPFLKAS